MIRQGLRELERSATHPAGRIRRPGGGRKKARQKDPTLVADLEKLIDPNTRGDPDEEMAQINLRRDDLHGEWNY